MMRLSDRLQYIAEQISDGETMADIGTDHGFLPVFLAESGRCPKVIMTDVSSLSLDKARTTAGQHGFGEQGEETTRHSDTPLKLDFRAGNGLSVLYPYEVDTVVIAGMGGKLIRDIMAADMELTCSFGRFVLQPRNGQGHLRKWLVDNGFAIIREGVVYEGRHIPEIITVLSPGTQHETLLERAERVIPDVIKKMYVSETDDIRWRIPPWLVYADGPVEAFLTRHTAAEEEKLDNVRLARKRDIALEEKIKQDIGYLKYLQELRKENYDGR